jgi:hypothetical protein
VSDRRRRLRVAVLLGHVDRRDRVRSVANCLARGLDDERLRARCCRQSERGNDRDNRNHHNP